MLEVHAVNAGDCGGHRENCGPGGKLSGDRPLPLLFEQGADLKHASQSILHAVDPDAHPFDMVEDVAEIRPYGLVDHRQVDPHQPAAHFDHRSDLALEMDDLAPQREQARDFLAAKECIDSPGFDLENVFLDFNDNRQIAVDDEVQYAVQDIVDAMG